MSAIEHISKIPPIRAELCIDYICEVPTFDNIGDVSYPLKNVLQSMLLRRWIYEHDEFKDTYRKLFDRNDPITLEDKDLMSLLHDTGFDTQHYKSAAPCRNRG